MSQLGPEGRAFVDRFRSWKHRLKDHRSGSATDMTTQQVYNQLMKESFAPALRGVGLKGSGGRFELPAENSWVQLGFQKSAFSDSKDLKFTVNLSVISRAIWTEQSLARPYLGKRPSPSTHYGSWAEQIRIGHLTPSGNDLWWSLSRGQNPGPVATEVVSTLVDLAVPWLIAKSTL